MQGGSSTGRDKINKNLDKLNKGNKSVVGNDVVNWKGVVKRSIILVVFLAIEKVASCCTHWSGTPTLTFRILLDIMVGNEKIGFGCLCAYIYIYRTYATRIEHFTVYITKITENILYTLMCTAIQH